MRRLIVVAAVALAVGLVVALGPQRPSSATGTLTGLSWSLSSDATGASTTASWTLDAASSSSLTSIQFGVPVGTTGTPSVTSTTAQTSYNVSTSATSVVLTGTALTVNLSGGYFPTGTIISVTVAGLVNPSTPTSVASTITTYDNTTAIDQGTTPALSLTSSLLTSCYETLSSTMVSASAVSASFSMTTTSSATLTGLSAELPPGGGGSPTLASVSPSTLSGGSLSLSNGVLTYTLASGVAVPSGTAVGLVVGGLANGGQFGIFGGEAVTLSASGPVDACAPPPVTLTSAALTALSWSASSTATGAAGVSYTYGFTTATVQNLAAFTFTVPPGTTGTPSVGAVSAQASYQISVASPTVALVGTTLKLSFTSVNFPVGTLVSVQINGLTNTSTAGTYASSILTLDGTGADSVPNLVDSGTTPSSTLTSASLTSLSWSVSSSAVGAVGTTYTYGFALTGDATLTSIMISLPPGTAGTPSLSAVNPSSISGGTLSQGSGTITYTFSATALTPSNDVSLAIGGMTNTSTAGVYAASVTVADGTTVLASGTTPSVSFTSTVLSGLSWTSTSTQTSTTNVSYTYGFTTASSTSITSFTMTVPSGTGGTPTLGTVSLYNGSQGTFNLATPVSVGLSGTTLTVSFGNTYMFNGTVVSIEINGLTNTSQSGSYTSAITTHNNTLAVDGGTTPALSFSSSVLSSPTWSVSSTAISATNVSYTFGFGISVAAPITTVTMTVPSGTGTGGSGGSVTVGTVTPSSIAGGTATLSGQLLTYTLPAATTLPSNTVVSIALTGLTNTSSAGSTTSTITALDDGTAQASGATPSVTFTATVLGSPTWSPSSTTTGSTGVTYTFSFVTGSTNTLSSMTMSVPPGTAGTPTLSSATLVESGGGNVTLASMSVSLVGTTLTLSFTGAYVPATTTVTLKFGGITNTSTPGSYSSAISTKNGSQTIDSGTTPVVSLYAAAVVLSSPQTLSWSATLTGQHASLVDATPSDQSYEVNDSTGTGNGWNVAVTATSFKAGQSVLSGATLSTNGNLSSVGATAAPTISCVSSCGALPSNPLAYPVTIPIGGSQSIVYEAGTATGSGTYLIGGSSATDPVAWWVGIPGNALAGAYASTITFAVSSGP